MLSMQSLRRMQPSRQRKETSGARARKVSLALEKELKNFRKVSLEATK